MKYTIKGSYIQEFVKEITAESLKDAWEIADALGREDIDPEEEIDQETNWGEVYIDSVMLEGHEYDPIKEAGIVDKYARKYMDEQSQQDFYKMFCTEAGNEDCCECLREGACCIDCKWRRSCKSICEVEKARQAMESWPGEKLADALIGIGDEHVIYLVVAERIKHLEKENARRSNRCWPKRISRRRFLRRQMRINRRMVQH